MTIKKSILLCVALEILIIAFALLTEGLSLTALQTITRYSGRLSLFVFSIIFLWGSRPATITALLSEKFYLVFAIVHGIHLIELLTYVSLSGIKLIPYRIAGGFLAYLFIFLMPMFQTFQERKRISRRRFFILEITFSYYVWFIFLLTYIPRVLGKLPHAGGSFVEHVVLLGLVIVLMIIKLADSISVQWRKMA